MDKIKAKLRALSQDRRYMFFVGFAVIGVGLIGAASGVLGVFLGFLLGGFCLLVGLYGPDVKKGIEELKHDLAEAKDGAAAGAKKVTEKAKEAADKALPEDLKKDGDKKKEEDVKEEGVKELDIAKDAEAKAEEAADKADSKEEEEKIDFDEPLDKLEVSSEEEEKKKEEKEEPVEDKEEEEKSEKEDEKKEEGDDEVVKFD